MFASTLFVLLAATQPAEPATPAEPAEGVDDPLGEIVVEPTSEGFRELPPFRVELVMLGEGKLAQEVHAAVTTDLLGFGRFIIVDDKATDDIHGKITVDVKALDDKQVVVAGVVQYGKRQVTIEPRVVEGTAQVGRGGHRFVDKAVEAFTGIEGPFAAPLIVVRTNDRKRQAWMFDIDGGEAKLLSDEKDTVSTVNFDSRGRPVWAKSFDMRPFEPAGSGRPAAVLPRGSVYGIAWSHDGKKLAVSVAGIDAIRLWTSEGKLSEFKPVGKSLIGMQPTWSKSGRLAYVGSNTKRRRIYVGTKVVSGGAESSSPTFCEHQDGLQLVWVEHFGKRSRLVVANADGTGHRVLETKSTRVSSPACAPDGRLVAFVVQPGGKSSPGVYVANLDRWRPRRMSSIVGDGLRWSPVRR
jgi:TolB protein